MRTIFALLLLASFAVAQGCVDLKAEAEAGNDVKALTGSFQACDSVDIGTYSSNYTNFSILGTAYERTAVCYASEKSLSSAATYYRLAGDMYYYAARSLCRDPSIRMDLLVSSGDMYALSGSKTDAKAAYERAVAFFDSHPGIPEEKRVSAAAKLFNLTAALPQKIEEVGGGDSRISFLPILIAGIVLVGIGFTLFFLRK
jgi:hypothetical protein